MCKGPLVLRLCLPLSFSRRGHYLIKKNGDPPAPPVPIDAQLPAVNKQTLPSCPVLPNILTIDSIITVIVKNIHSTMR